MNLFFRRTIPIILFFGVACLFRTGEAQAADPKLTVRDGNAFATQFVSQSLKDPLTIEAGETKTVVFTFKNTGTATWGKDKQIVAFTVNPKYRTSVFQTKNWLDKEQPAKMAGVVKPGQLGQLTLEITAPTKPGTYQEEFHLAALDYSWVKQGYFFLELVVVPSKKKDVIASKPIVVPVVSSTTSTSSVTARVVGVSQKKFDVIGGSTQSVVVIYQNTSQTQWKQYGLFANTPTALASLGSGQVSFADESWKSSSQVFQKTQVIPAGEFVRETLTFRAPKYKGEYTARFQLAVEGQPIGEPVELQLHVTEDAPDHYQEPVFFNNTNESTVIVTEPRLKEEPRIRVGLWKPTSTVQFEATGDAYIVKAGEVVMGELPYGAQASIDVLNDLYIFKSADVSFTADQYIRLEPKHDPHAIATILNYKRDVAWKGPRLFNTYRGAFEVRPTEGKTVYVINDLLFQDYMKGIGENANASNMEYLKAQAVAQRTYAYYIKEYSDKHDSRNFDVVATTGDQLYLGYENERIMPRFVEAVEATRGYMATYDVDQQPETPNDVVITPYFGNSNGRTRSWVEVWGGKEKPWLVSVKADYDLRANKKLFGHGVGMSQLDAVVRAEEEGLDWQSLVKYYYTGVSIERIY